MPFPIFVMALAAFAGQNLASTQNDAPASDQSRSAEDDGSYTIEVEIEAEPAPDQAGCQSVEDSEPAPSLRRAIYYSGAAAEQCAKTLPGATAPDSPEDEAFEDAIDMARVTPS
jgi:hypothetical protein